MKQFLIFLLLILNFSLGLYAQEDGAVDSEDHDIPSYLFQWGKDLSKSCGSEAYLKEQLNSNPEFKLQQEKFEKIYHQKMKGLKNSPQTKKTSSVYTIPTVVHIIHGGQPLGTDQNPTDSTIIAEFQQASQRFRHQQPGAGTYTNPNYGVDTEIEFCLVDTDPNGNYTTGIIRYFDPSEALPSNLNNWDITKYHNVYIVQSANWCGLSTGTSTLYRADCFWDGLIAHEVGHYFSLNHTFSGNCINNDCLLDGDKVCDTPPKQISGTAGGSCSSPGNNCTTDENDTSTNNPYRAISLGGMGDQLDMLENYLDYSGGCWDSFTEAQKSRMHLNIQTFKQNLVNNTVACNSFAPPNIEAGIVKATFFETNLCDPDRSGEFTIKNYGQSNLTNVDIIVQIDNGVAFTYNWTGNLTTGQEAIFTMPDTIPFPIGSDLVLKIYTDSPNNAIDEYPNNDTLFHKLTTPYLGGDTCITYSACESFNVNTLSGPGNLTVINLTGTTAATPNQNNEYVRLCVQVEGDVNSYPEFFDILDEDGNHQGVTNYASSYCGGLSDPVCFDVTFSKYDTWRSNDTITVTLDPVATYIGLPCTINQGCLDVIVPQGTSSVFHGCTDVNAHNYESTAIYNMGVCKTCNDGIQNGDESFTDCGGNLCVACPFEDASVTAIFVNDTCKVTGLNLEAEITNYGINNLTSTDIEVYLDGTLVQTSPWTGNLVYGEKDTISFPYLTASFGNIDILISTNLPNGLTDEKPSNDEFCLTYFSDYYCAINSSSKSFWIDSIAANTNVGYLNNQSGDNNGFGDFTAISTSCAKGHPVNFSFTPSVNNQNFYWNIYIDWNQDNDFDDNSELVYTSQNSSIVNGDFSVPSDAMLGNTRMRVIMSSTSLSQSYGILSTGEAEDYTINVIDNGCYTIANFTNYENGFELGFETWQQAITDDIDWTLRTGSTPSNTTGPNQALEGNQYIYIEATSNLPNKLAQLDSPCFDLSGFAIPELLFNYHMYGSHINSLNFLISTDEGLTWSNIFTKSGEIGDFWIYEIIDLSSYAGATVKLRLEGITGLSYRSDIALDNIIIRESAIGCLPTYSNNCSSGDVIQDFIFNDISNINSGCGNGGASNFSDYFYTYSTPLSIGLNNNITVSAGNSGQYYITLIDLNNDGDFIDIGEFFDIGYVEANTSLTKGIILSETVMGARRMRVISSRGNTPITVNDICNNFIFGEVEDYRVDLIPGCSIDINAFPYLTNFESSTYDWSQSVYDDFNWTILSGATGSNNTGPSSAYEGSSYLYMEASGPNYPNKEAILFSPCLDLATITTPTISFAYHMYGVAMGDLFLEVSTNGVTWSTPVWSASGDQGDMWHIATVNLSNYVGQTIIIRFRGVTASSFESDIAIDAVNILDLNCPSILNLIAPYNTTLDLESSDKILATNQIQTGANITYDAQNCIELNFGFEVETGAVFQAIIDGCGGQLQNDEDSENSKSK